jgi:hypothetical protein
LSSRPHVAFDGVLEALRGHGLKVERESEYRV